MEKSYFQLNRKTSLLCTPYLNNFCSSACDAAKLIKWS